MANRKRDPSKERFWRQVVRRQAASGLSAAEFCRRERLSQPSFYAWRRTLCDSDRGATGRDPRRDRSGANGPRGSIGFLPVQVAEGQPGREAAADALTLELAGGLVLRLPGSIPAHRLAELVSALAETRP